MASQVAGEGLQTYMQHLCECVCVCVCVSVWSGEILFPDHIQGSVSQYPKYTVIPYGIDEKSQPILLYNYYIILSNEDGPPLSASLTQIWLILVEDDSDDVTMT